MKKHILLILLFFFGMLFNIYIINAETYTCAYSIEYFGEKSTFSITFDTEQKTETFSNLCKENGACRGSGVMGILDDQILASDQNLADSKEELNEEYDQKVFSGKCDTTLLVFRYWSNGAQTYYYKILFNDTLEANAREYMSTGFGSGTHKELTDAWATFDPANSTAEADDITFECKGYGVLFKKIENASQKINDCGNDCMDYRVIYKTYKNKLISYCRSQFEYADYGKSCLTLCMNLEEELQKLGVEQNFETTDCNFSQRLIAIVGDIIRLIKYILPVIAIVLGILDFIKAIASDKDDEMKKAQGKFIKRLISAALVFIIPLILEFILIKMGFDYNECGLFD